MKIGLCTSVFNDQPFDVALDLAARAGFDGVGIWRMPGHMPEGYDRAHNLRVAEAVRARGLVVSQFRSYANPVRVDFDRRMDDSLKIAQDLGADRVQVWAGRTGSAQADKAQWEAVISTFRVSADHAADLGITLVAEMHAGCLTDTAKGSLRLVEGVDRPNFRLGFDPTLFHDQDRALKEIRLMAPYVVTVCAQNYARVGARQHSLISKGFVDYPAVIAAFRKAGFDDYVEVESVREADPEAALAADARFLRALCDSPLGRNSKMRSHV